MWGDESIEVLPDGSTVYRATPGMGGERVEHASIDAQREYVRAIMPDIFKVEE